MSYRAIAAALALRDVSTGERLALFSLASYANSDQQGWPSDEVAAIRAGLARSRYLAARGALAERGLIRIEHVGRGRGKSSLVSLLFAEHNAGHDGEINAELFEAVLCYSRTRGSDRLLLAALAALSDPIGLVADLSTKELRAAAGLSDRSYRRAREQLLAGVEVELEQAGGGRAKTNRWLVHDPRIAGVPPIDPRPRRRRSSGHNRPLLVSQSAELNTGGSHCHPETRANAGPLFGKPRPKQDPFCADEPHNPGQNWTLSPETPAETTETPAQTPAETTETPAETPAETTETPAETPAKTPAPSVRAGKEPQNLRTIPPNPPDRPAERIADQDAAAMGDAEQVCQEFLAAWAPVLGVELVDLYRSDEVRWTKAARRLGARHSHERLRAAFAQMLEDEIIGSQATTLPKFERVVDRLLARRNALQNKRPAATTPRGDAGWSGARARIEQAIKRHGRDHRKLALADLAAVDPRLVTFVERVGWLVLCEQEMRFAEPRYRAFWLELAENHQPRSTEDVA
jgi:hypothetical protein